MDDLQAKLVLDMSAALQSIDNLGAKLDGLFKKFEGGSGGGGSRGGAFGNQFKESLGLIRAEAVKLGRDMDVVNAKFGVGSKESAALSVQLKKTAQSFSEKNRALKALADQFKAGEISMTQFKTGVINVQSAISNLNNKLSGVSPIRNMQKDIQGLNGAMNNLVSTALPGFSGLFSMLGSIKQILNTGLGGAGAVFSQAPEAVSSEYLNKLLQGRQAVSEMGTAASASAPGFLSMASAVGIATVALGALVVGITAFKTASSAIKVGAEFEAMEYQMTALINASTKFKDDTTGQFVSLEKNLELSLGNAKQIIATFVKDAPKLAGTNLKELTETASVTLGGLASNGITDPKEQAKLIESMTVAIKTVTAGQQNAGVQLAQESRALLEGQFLAGNKLIKQLATNVGGQDAFKKLFDDAKKAGKLGEFLEQQLKPYLAAAAFAQDSFGNLGEILSDFTNNTLKTIADNGVFQAAKDNFKALLSPFVELEDESKFGQLKDSFKSLAADIGASIASLMTALQPFAPALGNFFIVFLKFIPPVLSLITPFVSILATLTNSLATFLATSSTGQALLQGLLTAFITFQAVSFLPALFTSIGTALAILPNLLALTTGGFAALNAVMLANPAGLVVAALAGLTAAFIAVAPGVEELTNIIGNSMSQNVQSVLDGSNQMKGILDDLQANNALTVDQINQLWNSGLLTWYQKTGIILKSLVTDFQTTFSYLSNLVNTFFLSLLQKAQNAMAAISAKLGSFIGKSTKSPIPTIVGNVVSGLFTGQAARTKAEITKKKKEQDKLLTDIFNKEFKLGASGKIGGGGGFTGIGPAAVNEAGKKSKTPKGPADKSAQLQKAENEIAKAKEQLNLAKEIAATDERINKIKEIQATLNSNLADLEIALSKKKDSLSAQEKGLSLEQKKINLAYENGQLTLTQKLQAENQVAIKKIEIDYQQQLVQIDLKRIEFQKELINLESENLQRAEGLKEANAKVDTINKQIEAQRALNSELVRNKGESDQNYELRAEQNTKKVLELEKAAIEAKSAVDKLLSGDKQADTQGNERVNKLKQEIESLSQSASQSRTQALEELNIDFELQKKGANTFGNIVRDAGKGFITDIAQGMKAGDGFLGAVTMAAEKFISTISDNLINIGIEKMFKGGNPFAAFTGGGQGGGGQAGGGIFGKMKSAGGLGALGGPIGAIVGLGITAIGAIGGGLMSRWKKKKEEKKQLKQLMNENIKWLEEFRFANYIDDIKRSLETYFENLDRSLAEVDKRIAKLNTSGSSFDASKAIKETQGKIKMLNNAISQTIRNGNQQVNAFANEANVIEAQLRSKGKWKQADWDKWRRLVEIREKLIPEIQRASAKQVKSLIDQQKELNDEIQAYIDQQKQLAVDIGKEAKVAEVGLKFGSEAEGFMSEIIAFQDKVRELLLSGLDTGNVNTIIENEKRKLDESIQTELSGKAEEFKQALMDSRQNLADEILGINEEMLDVLDEGRSSGFLKATNQDKINQLEDRLKRTQAAGRGEIAKTQFDEAAFQKQSDYFVTALDSGIKKVFEDVKNGLSELDSVQVVVNDPKFIAAEIERIWNEKQKMPSFLTRAV